MTTMAETLRAYWDCDALSSPEFVGRLTRLSQKGAPDLVFEFENSWLPMPNTVK